MRNSEPIIQISPQKSVRMKPWLPILEGCFYATLIAAVFYIALPYEVYDQVWRGTQTEGLFRDTFARRYNGGCSGWTYELTLASTVTEVVSWYAYMIIAFVLIRLHPIHVKMRGSKFTVLMIFWLFILCGMTHLLTAYTNLHPTYNLLIFIKAVNAAVSLAAGMRIAWALIHAFKIIGRSRERAEAVIEMARKHGLKIGPDPFDEEGTG
jgi:hypothetical protein